MSQDLLSLVCDFDGLVTQRHPGSILFGGDSSLLCIVFHKGDAFASWDHSDLLESIITAKYSSEGVDIVVVGKILHKQNFVRWEVFVGDDGRGGGTGRFQTSRSGNLGRPTVRGWAGISFGELPLCFGSFEGFPFVCVARVSAPQR